MGGDARRHAGEQTGQGPASMGLFASIALMFWYILRLFMSRD
jgi:hypothetical protein